MAMDDFGKLVEAQVAERCDDRASAAVIPRGRCREGRGDAPDPGAAPASEERRSAASLREAATLLEAQGATPFRVAAYRRAAGVVEAQPAGALRALFERQGRRGLAALPAVGAGIAGAIAEMLLTGGWAQLERLRGSHDPEAAFRAIPGIGPALSRRLHETLGVDNLESLEAAAFAGRLQEVPGMGPRRSAAVQALVGRMLDTGGRRPSGSAGYSDAPVEVLLDVDREYRQRALGDELPRIAPRRLNPGRAAWLPILHTRRGPWQVTALYSNTARAHALGREHDWVVLYAFDREHRERQHTVVTESRGPLRGKRVVRGAEHECHDFYARAGLAPSPPMKPAGSVGPATPSLAPVRGPRGRSLVG